MTSAITGAVVLVVVVLEFSVYSSSSTQAHPFVGGHHGLCYAGTIIDVLLPGNPRVFWGYITPDNVVKTVDSYITNNKIVKQNLLGSLGEESIKGVSKFTDLPGVKYQSRIALKNSATVPELQVSSDSTAMQLGRTSTGGAGINRSQ